MQKAKANKHTEELTGMFAKTKRDFWACQEADQIFIKCAYDLIPLLMFRSSDEHYQSVM